MIVANSCQSLSPVDGRAERFVTAASPDAVLPHWRPLAEDILADVDCPETIDYYAGRVARPRMEFHALRINLACRELRIVTAGGAGELSGGTFASVKVSAFVRDGGLLAGINALPFDPSSEREGEPRTNRGIVITDGLMVSPPHPQFDALVVYADGSAAIVAQNALYDTEEITHAVGGFYRILENHTLVPWAHDTSARYPRSAAGISADGRFLYLLVIDGRRPGSIGGTVTETALLLRALGAGDGINLDGGGSSALALRYPDGAIRAVNTPVHRLIPGRERAVAGCLGVGVRQRRLLVFAIQ